MLVDFFSSVSYLKWYSSRPEVADAFDIPIELWTDGYDAMQFSDSSLSLVVITVIDSRFSCFINTINILDV